MFSRRFVQRVLTTPKVQFYSTFNTTPKFYQFDRIGTDHFKELDDMREAEIINMRQQLSSPMLDPLITIFGFLGEKRWAFDKAPTRPALEKYQSALTKHPKAEVAIILTCQSAELAKELSLKTPRENFLVIGVKPPIITGLPMKALDIDKNNVVDIKNPRSMIASDFSVFKSGQLTESTEIKKLLEDMIKSLEVLNRRE